MTFKELDLSSNHHIRLGIWIHMALAVVDRDR